MQGLIRYEKIRLLDQRNLFWLLIFILGSNAAVIFFFKLFSAPEIFASEIAAIAKLVFIPIVYWSALNCFQYIFSGMEKQAVATLRSKTLVFWQIIVRHMATSIVLCLLVLPSFIFLLLQQPTSQYPINLNRVDLWQYLFKSFVLVVASTALTTPFIFYFKRASRFLLGIYFIPQSIGLIPILCIKLLGWEFMRYEPVTILNDLMKNPIDPIAIGILLASSIASIFLCKRMYLRQ